MKKAKGEDRSNSMDMISELPKEMLQRILYFLSQEEAVRTSVLSKSWRYIWCTRPNLHCSDETFEGNKQDFLSVVNNSLQRYCVQRLCLEEFNLSLSLGNYACDQESVSLLEKWIPLLTTMGVKEFHLCIRSNNLNVDLPSVVFEAESLKLLDLRSFNLVQNIPEIIPFDRLEELRLCNVNFIKNEIFDKIISSCPLLTTMLFKECKGLKTIKLEKKLHKYLKHFTFINLGTHATEECSIEIDDIPTLETVKIFGSKIRFHGLKFCNLKSLCLKKVKISSNSVEQSQLLCIDAPNIEYFDYAQYCDYAGLSIPSISFTPTLRSSNLQLYISRNLDDAQSWFLRLSKQLHALRQSQIRTIILISCNNLHIREGILVQDIINGGNKPVVVEQLELNIYHLSSCMSVLNGLFCICRPRTINLWWHRQGRLEKKAEHKELSEFFSKFQMMIQRGNQGIRQDLENLTIERFDRSRGEWQPLQGTTLLECALLNINHLHFLLKWNHQDC